MYEGETFLQRYTVDESHWKGPGWPFLVVFGGENPFKYMIDEVGIVSEAAPKLGALVLYIEHRFYGTSVPYGSIMAALFAPEVRGYLTSAQALADFAQIILSVKAKLSTPSSPVIVIGGSYAGMLAAWFRLKYSHIAIGALASSAPILYFEKTAGKNDYCSIVSRDFEQVNKKCSEMISQSWSMIDQIAAQPGGLAALAKTFNVCLPLRSTYELKYSLARMYTFAAQYNGRYNYWINRVCDPIVGASDAVDGVARSFLGMNPAPYCMNLSITGGAAPYDVVDEDSLRAWQWQKCSELVLVEGCNGADSMIPREFFHDQTQIMVDCRLHYLTFPDPNWVPMYYGGESKNWKQYYLFKWPHGPI